ncbi:MAG TPA: tetratricopeptide repeat protein [Bryobacteraceae bacterium]|jgi:tetratricopeptide (TPR) repeat protein
MSHRFWLSLLVLAATIASSNGQVSTGASEVELNLQEFSKEINQGDSAVSKEDLSAARTHFASAVALAKSLPEGYLKQRSDALKKLAEVHDAQHHPDEAEPLLKERISILERSSSSSGLMAGIAWFDLETHYAMAGQLDESVESAQRATAFYLAHMTDPKQSKTCDRRLADVEGMVGVALFRARRFAESEPWIKKVVSREDRSVRPLIMIGALQAWAFLLEGRGKPEGAALAKARASRLETQMPIPSAK